MKKIKLSIANANGNFSDKQIATFYNDTDLAEKFISDNFDFDYEVDVIVTPESYLQNLIPEDRISGRTYRSDLIIITIDAQSKTAQNFLFETLCHELSHSLRWKKLHEHSKTLFDDVMMEGLAVVLEEKALKDTNTKHCQYFLDEVRNTDNKIIESILKEFGNLEIKDYDYAKLFIDGDEQLPRWSGYKLGYYLINKYIKDNNTNIHQATIDSYEKFKPLLR